MVEKKKDEDDEAFGGREKIDRAGRKPKLKGGRRVKRDKQFGINDPWFWRWWHRVRKPQLGGVDGTGDDIQNAYDDWVSDGKPKVK